LIGRDNPPSGDRNEEEILNAQYDVLLAMFCNEWTWVSLKRVQIEGVKKEQIKALWALEEREKRTCGPAKPDQNQFVFRIILTARGL
jgi:hypothetical protein